jgi:hypothetical protein
MIAVAELSPPLRPAQWPRDASHSATPSRTQPQADDLGCRLAGSARFRRARPLRAGIFPSRPAPLSEIPTGRLDG